MPPPSPADADPLVTVRVVTHPVEANLIRAQLESYGIPAILQSPTLTNPAIRGINVSPIGDIQIRVASSRSEEAIDLLKAMEEGGLRDEFSNEDAGSGRK